MSKRDNRRNSDDLNDQFKHARRRTLAAAALAIAALIVAIQHLLAHAGWRPVPLTMGAQDLFMGYPVAMLIGVAAVFIWGSIPSRG